MFRASDFKTYFCILVKFTNHIIKISTKLQNSILSAPKKAKLFKKNFFSINKTRSVVKITIEHTISHIRTLTVLYQELQI